MIALSQSASAVTANITASFLATGGQAPYVYSVIAGGANGSINSRTGVYTAPAILSSSPKQAYDTIRVVDNLAATTTSQILVGNPLLLFCDIIQQGMGLANGRVYLFDQKIFQPTDYDVFVVVFVQMPKPFGNNTQYTTSNTGVLQQVQSVNMYASLDVNIISRGPAARDRKEEVILSLNSTYSEQQQEANSFYIGKLSHNFIDLSSVDGAAIPYRYQISCAMQYVVTKTSPVLYYNQFSGYSVTTSN